MTKLEQLIINYAENKNQSDALKKVCDKENAQIKKMMLSDKLDTKEAGEYKATCTVSKRETMREDDLISLFTSVPAFVTLDDEYGIVRQKPYIDFDVLEKIIYDGKMTTEQLLELDKAKDVKEVVTLRVTKIKAKKEEE